MESSENVVPEFIRYLSRTHELRSYLSPLYGYPDGQKQQVGWQFEIAGTTPPWIPFAILEAAAETYASQAVQVFARWVADAVEDLQIEAVFEGQKTYFWSQHQNRPDKIVTLEIRVDKSQSFDKPLPDKIAFLERLIAFVIGAHPED